MLENKIINDCEDSKKELKNNEEGKIHTAYENAVGVLYFTYKLYKKTK